MTKTILSRCLTTKKSTGKQKIISVRGIPEFVEACASLGQNSVLKKSIDAALDKLKEDPLAGDRIQKKLWPKKYVKAYSINNLFRYGLAEGYRLTYTIIADGKIITCVVLEALDHGSYDDLFGYHTS